MLLGAAGFIGTNLTLELLKDDKNNITVVDEKEEYFSNFNTEIKAKVKIQESSFSIETDFEELLSGQEIIYHLVSTTAPTTSNQYIAQELTCNVVATAKMLDTCVKCGIQKVVFISSGGTVYGKEARCPLKEDTVTYPISSYGIQKVTIEKLLYLYWHMYGLDYRIIRLANPYGPYQRPNGMLGVITTFTYKALRNEEIVVYGDGSVVRDFIYIDDAVKGIITIADGKDRHRTFNLGCGYGTSIKKVLEVIQNTLREELKVSYKPRRNVDVPINFLDISRYEAAYGKLTALPLDEGIRRTADFMHDFYQI